MLTSVVTRCEVDGGSLFPEIKWAKVKRVENSKDIFLLIRYLLWIHRYIYTIYIFLHYQQHISPVQRFREQELADNTERVEG